MSLTGLQKEQKIMKPNSCEWGEKYTISGIKCFQVNVLEEQ